jgi:hypothetical protein
VLVAGLGSLQLFTSQRTLNPNQGLQQWSERLCARMPANAEGCAAPATARQWYGQEGQP